MKKQNHIFRSDKSSLCGSYEEIIVSDDVFYDFPNCFQCELEEERENEKRQVLAIQQEKIQSERFNKLSLSLKKELKAFDYFNNATTHLF